MKNSKINLIILATLGICLFSFALFPIISINLVPVIRDKDNESLKISISHSPIYINDADPGYNWSVAEGAGICTGNGTYSNPYLIEDFEINGAGLGVSCILIENSDVFFRIENCTAYSSSGSAGNSGIELYSVDNGQLIDNDCYTHGDSGIELDYCTNITISGNTLSDNYAGIKIKRSSNNTVSENTLDINGSGIWLDLSEDINISGNTINDGFYTGIRLGSSNNNTVSGNIANNNGGAGIRLLLSNNNTVSGNTASYNTRDGINLDSSNDNTFSGNIANNNHDDGIYLDSSNNNTLSGNTGNSIDGGGIHLINSDSNTFSGNAASFNTNDGINLGTSNDNTLLGNTANHNDNDGIDLKNSDDNAILGNNLLDNDLGICLDNSERIEMSGNIIDLYALQLFGNLQILASHNIDNTNLVNGKPIYYYANEVNLGASDFTNAGQVILVNCNDSSISNLNISYGPTGISLYYCNANNISGNAVSSNKYNGISLYYSDDNAISGNTVNSNIDIGIYLDSSNNNTVSGNLFTGNGLCINETNCVGNEFSNNGDCLYGIAVSGDDIPGYNLYILIGIMSVLLVLSIRIKKKRKISVVRRE